MKKIKRTYSTILLLLATILLVVGCGKGRMNTDEPVAKQAESIEIESASKADVDADASSVTAEPEMTSEEVVEEPAASEDVADDELFPIPDGFTDGYAPADPSVIDYDDGDRVFFDGVVGEIIDVKLEESGRLYSTVISGNKDWMVILDTSEGMDYIGYQVPALYNMKRHNVCACCGYSEAMSKEMGTPAFIAVTIYDRTDDTIHYSGLGVCNYFTEDELIDFVWSRVQKHIESNQENDSSSEIEGSTKAETDEASVSEDENENRYEPTAGERNALQEARNYLNIMPFSYSGLIAQLKYEQYTDSEAKYAADNCGADWNEQAAKAAKSYLDLMPFSHGELVDQLVYEGYTAEQAEFGVSAAGL